MTKQEVVNAIIRKLQRQPATRGVAFAPANIALCKYWGKRNESLNLPVTSSLSISLAQLGTQTEIVLADREDTVVLNDNIVKKDTSFYQQIVAFLDLFRADNDSYFTVVTTNNIPTAAGLASSASGFAALVLALNELYGWQLQGRELSILARLGSGSACRSIYHGFVEWHRGTADDGMDCYAAPVPDTWPELRIGVITLETGAKPVSSRQGMQRTVATCRLYKCWPDKVAEDLENVKSAITHKNFDQLGQTAESNALAMHATMISTWPPIVYWLPESLAVMHKIWQLRQDGLQIYFTMDAGPNVKLLLLEHDQALVKNFFPGVAIIAPFAT